MAAAAPRRIRRGAPLRTLSWWRIGGQAELLVEDPSDAELRAVLAVLHREGRRPVIIGHGANLLFDDAGYGGVLIRIGPRMSRVRVAPGGWVRAQAGVWTPAFARRVMTAGLGGAEHAVGIPGTLGGLLAMNGGSGRRTIGEHLVASRVAFGDRVEVLRRDDLRFGHRASRLQSEGVLLDAVFRFPAAGADGLRREALSLLAERRRKFPRKEPNCGSVFVSDPALYASVGPPGRILEALGLKGCRVGDAMISPRHANFIVNLGAARSRDVLELIGIARRKVWDATGVWLRCEVRHLPPSGDPRPAHLSL